MFDKSRLSFFVDIPENYVPDNYFCAQLFEHCEVRVNHVSINNKSSDNDYALGTYFLTRMNFDESTLRMTGSLDGYFSCKNYDSARLRGEQKSDQESVDSKFEINVRRANCVRKVIGDKTYYRYFFICRINAGIAMTSRPLPKDVPIKLVFYRADASRSLVSVVEDDTEKFPTREIVLQDVTFLACLTQSDYYDRKYAPHRLTKEALPFLEPLVRRELLMNNISQFKVKVSDGRLPIALGLALIEPSAFDGDFKESSVNFKMHGLESVDIQVDSRSLPGYPLEIQGGLAHQFYYKFLRECNFIDNHLSSGPIDATNFTNFNFIVMENFKRKKIYDGQLTVILKFTKDLTKKLHLILFPITQKKISFDEHLNVNVSDMFPDDADKAENDYND